MSNAAVAYYSAQVRELALRIYAVHGEHIGNMHARASIRASAEVLAEMAGRERAVALLDELSHAVLSETKLLDMPTLLAPAPVVEPPPAPSPNATVPPPEPIWTRVTEVILPIGRPGFLRGVLWGFWLYAALRSLVP